MWRYKIYYLYRITNQLDKKVYIGQTVKPEYRWYQHRSYSSKENKHKQYIHRAMAKHGIENFSFEVIASCQTQEDATETENILIAEYNSRNPEFGYNLVTGVGYGGHSEETKEKIRQATIKQIAEKGHPATGRIVSEEEKELRRKNRLENPIEYTEEIRKNMSAAHIGIRDSEETKQNKSEAQKVVWEQKMEVLETPKCSAPGCDVSGFYIKYKIINGIRYCFNHGQKFERSGTLDVLPQHIQNNQSEEERKKCGQANIGRIPVNKITFSNDQIKIICDLDRSVKSLSREFGVTEKVIVRVRKENALV